MNPTNRKPAAPVPAPAAAPKEAPPELLAPAQPAPENAPAKKKTPAQIQAENTKKLTAYLEKMRGAMAAVIPKTLKPDRLIKLAISAYNTSPLLAQCDFASIALSLMHAAELGLEPNTALGHCYLIPRRNGKTGNIYCTFLVGYRGMIELSRRSGEIETIEAQVVRKGDKFEVEYGCDKHLRHLPSYSAESAAAEMVAVYAIAKMKDGGYQFEVMSKAEIDAIRNRADEASRRKSGPWDTDYIEMARKTVVRRLFKYLPVSTEAQRGISAALAIEDDGGAAENLLDSIKAEALAAGSDAPLALPEPEEAPTATLERGIMPEQATDRLAEALTA